MILENIRLLIAAQFAAPYEGNVISSFKYLEKLISKKFRGQIAYLFPKAMLNQPWAEEFIKKHKTYTSGNGKTLIFEEEANEIINDFEPDLIYTHFEGYDIPLNKAVKRSGMIIRQIWHMRDTLNFIDHPLKALYQHKYFFKHYGIPFFNKKELRPSIIANSQHEIDFIKRFRIGKKIKEQVIPNGLDFSRIQTVNRDSNNETYTFLAFGGRNVQKRIDILLKAGDILNDKKIPFKIIITKGTDTEEVVNSFFNNNIPNWLTLTNQTTDLTSFFARGDCFIITSIYETFCNAIAEATMAGLPVIRSEIKGTEWSKQLPSIQSYEVLNANALSEAMISAIEIPNESLSTEIYRSKEILESEYSMGIWTKRIIDFFQNIP